MIEIETLKDGIRFIFDPQRDGWIPHQYEETKQYDSFYGFKPDWTVVDVGAWIGLWALWAAPQVKKVYALEPVPELFNLLCRNIALNGLDGANLMTHKLALSSMSGRPTMRITGLPSASSLIPDVWNYGAEWLYKGGREIEVEALTWDDFVIREEIDKVELINMDVEGGELEVLAGMTEVLPERISIAIYHIPAPLLSIMQVLTKKGYIFEGFGYYDRHAKNKGKPHSGFFRRKNIPFETPETYVMGEYELPSKEEMDRGIPFYWGDHK